MGVPRRHKIAKTEAMKIQEAATATILKISFRHLFPNLWLIWAETCSVATGQPGMGNFRINPDFRIENFHFKHEISLSHLYTIPFFCVKSIYLG